ncbi:MAG: helix-turn-helix transcriptional regulator [Actinomycetota bacterium]|nr:helix-turn-helix transcriptional regulator [Actinomycetota bacterium]
MTGRRQWVPNEICSVAQTLEIIGERWAILVLREAFLGTRRFEDFQHNIGCARNILSDRLQKLVENGILERRRYQDRPPRFEYRLTEKGIDLYPILVGLMQWGDRYVAGERGPAIVLDHKTCGHETTPELVCSHCGERVNARTMRARLASGEISASA